MTAKLYLRNPEKYGHLCKPQNQLIWQYGEEKTHIALSLDEIPQVIDGYLEMENESYSCMGLLMVTQSQAASPKHIYIWETLNRIHSYTNKIIKDKIINLKGKGLEA